MKFHFDENMYGSWRRAAGGGQEGRFDFTCRAEADSLRRFLADRTTRLTGTVTMEGVVEGVPFEGTLKIDPILGHELVYDFTFKAGKSMYRFLGRKNVDFKRPVWTMTHMVGQVEKDGMTFANVDSHFDLKELPKLVLSVRPGL